MKLLLLCGPQANQRALAAKLHAAVPLHGIVVVDPPGGVGARKQGLLRRLPRAVAGLPLRRAWFGMLNHYERGYPAFPIEPVVRTPDVNATSVIGLVERERPDLVLVSGTNLLKGPLIKAIGETGRILNLHTGISPYVKGGPNCTNWCLAIGRYDLIGNTIMWLDEGIDSGNLAATERTPLSGDESLTELHIKVMEHAHDLYVRCVELYARGDQLPNVPQQSIGEGQLFLSRQWTPGPMARAAANYHLRYRRGAMSDRRSITLVSPLEGAHRAP